MCQECGCSLSQVEVALGSGEVDEAILETILTESITQGEAEAAEEE